MKSRSIRPNRCALQTSPTTWMLRLGKIGLLLARRNLMAVATSGGAYLFTILRSVPRASLFNGDAMGASAAPARSVYLGLCEARPPYEYE